MSYFLLRAKCWRAIWVSKHCSAIGFAKRTVTFPVKANFIKTNHANRWSAKSLDKAEQGDNRRRRSNDNRRPLRAWDIVTPLLIFLGVVDDLEKRESPLIISIKRGILAKQRRQYQQADVHLHIALKLAQDLADHNAETYIFDVLADNFFAMESYRPAKDLYMEVLARLSNRDDFSLDCEALVEISIKFATCLSQLGEVSDAEKGFQYAIDTQRSRTDTFWDDKTGQILGFSPEALNDTQRNSLALLGMSYDYYSKHLLHAHLQPKVALTYRLKALNISRAVNGAEHEQTLVLENDLAELYIELGDNTQAKHHLRTAIEYGRTAGETRDMPIFYLNIASVHYRENRADLARAACRKSLDFLLKQNNDPQRDERSWRRMVEYSERCLDGIADFFK